MKITTFTLLIISKTSVFGLSNVLFNSTALFSSTNIVTDAFFAVYSINVTWYGYYCFFEQVISWKRYKNNESAMPFPIAKHYAYVRDYKVGKWLPTFGLWVIMFYYSAAICFGVPFYAYGSVPDKNGKDEDMWTVGMMIYFLCVWFCHYLFLTHFKNIDRTIGIIMFIILIQWIIVAFVINAIIRLDPMWKSVWEKTFQV